MKIDLSGKRILVTGGSRGIGRALAEAMADAGAQLAVHCHSRMEDAFEVAERAAPGSVALTADLADPEACRDLFDETIASLGGLDVLVNNAAIALEMPMGQDEEDWLEDFDQSIAVNLRAVEYLSRRAIRHMSDNGGGRLIHIASRAAFRGDTPGYMTYAATKGGMVALSRSIARAFGKQGICSFVIAPGFVRTDMAQDFIDRYGEAHVANDLALDRLTEPSDLAPLAVLLASGLADHATGTSIDVNAGSYVR